MRPLRRRRCVIEGRVTLIWFDVPGAPFQFAFVGGTIMSATRGQKICRMVAANLITGNLFPGRTRPCSSLITSTHGTHVRNQPFERCTAQQRFVPRGPGDRRLWCIPAGGDQQNTKRCDALFPEVHTGQGNYQITDPFAAWNHSQLCLAKAIRMGSSGGALGRHSIRPAREGPHNTHGPDRYNADGIALRSVALSRTGKRNVDNDVFG